MRCDLVYHTPLGTNSVDVRRIEKAFPVTIVQIGPSESVLSPLVSTLQDMLSLDRRLYRSAVSSCFGLELRVAFALTEDGKADGGNPRELMLRPAVEPILYSYWDRFRAWALDDESVAALAGCLCGRAVTHRKSFAATLPNSQGLSAIYPPPELARRWREIIPSPTTGAGMMQALHDAFVVMGLFVNLHPLEDGNGRVGRALFQGALARAVGLSCPMLALTPFLYSQKQDVLRGWFALGNDGDWTELVGAYGRAMRACVDYQHAMTDLE